MFIPFVQPVQVRVTANVVDTREVPQGARRQLFDSLDFAALDRASQIWDGGRLFMASFEGIKETDPVQPPLRFGKPPTDLAWHFNFDLVDGVAYAWGQGEDWAPGQKGRNYREVRATTYIYRNSGSRWDLWDTLNSTKEDYIHWLRPLEGGGYLLGGAFQDKVADRCYPFAIATNSGHGAIRIHETEDAGFSEPSYIWGNPAHIFGPEESQSANYDRMRWMPNPKLMGAYDAIHQLSFRAVRVPGHLVLVGRRLGVFIVLDGRTGRVQRVERLFNELPEDAWADPSPYEPALLGVQPRSGGHLLIAARSEDAVLKARTARVDLPAQAPVRLSASESFGLNPEEQEELVEQKQDQATTARTQAEAEARFQQYPELVWWDFDPDTGAFHREPSPMGVPERFPSIDALQAFGFQFKADGDLEIEPKVWK